MERLADKRINAKIYYYLGIVLILGFSAWAFVWINELVFSYFELNTSAKHWGIGLFVMTLLFVGLNVLYLIPKWLLNEKELRYGIALVLMLVIVISLFSMFYEHLALSHRNLGIPEFFFPNFGLFLAIFSSTAILQILSKRQTARIETNTSLVSPEGIFRAKPEDQLLNQTLFWGSWLLLFLLWNFSTFFSGALDVSQWPLIVLQILWTLGVTYINLTILVPRFLLRNQYGVYAHSLAFMIILYLMIQFGLQEVFLQSQGDVLRESMIGSRLLNSNLSIFAFALISSTIIKVARHGNRKQRFQDQLEKERLALELKFLKAQLNPHFFMNTLNTLYGLAIQKSDLTPDAILQLSELMKYLLQVTKANELVTLAKEIRFTKTYLRLIHLRFDREENIQFEVEGRPAGKMVVPLLFISFLENSLEHGIGTMGPEGYVRSKMTMRPDNLHFWIENNYKPGVKPRFKQETGLGIPNIKRQLELYYPGRHELVIEDEGGVYSVRLEIRFEEAER
jgi:sensor histidine kinase YesM